MLSGKFQKFDYLDGNVKEYGTKEPPEYDVSKITTKFHVFYGEEDLVMSKAVSSYFQISVYKMINKYLNLFLI